MFSGAVEKFFGQRCLSPLEKIVSYTYATDEQRDQFYWVDIEESTLKKTRILSKSEK